MRVSEALMAGKEKKAMTIHEIGDKSNPVLMLSRGRCAIGRAISAM